MQRLSLITLALATLSAPALAVSNGQFTQGLNGWDTLGDVSVQSPNTLVLTSALDATDDLGGSFNFSGAPAQMALNVGGVEEFAGLSIGALNGVNPGLDEAAEGSVARQMFSVQAGDTLSLSWQLLTNEQGPDAKSDLGFLVLNGTLFELALAPNATGAGALGFAAGTGWSTFTHTFTQSGLASLALGVVDRGDFVTTSALAVQNVSITPVPEPRTWALVLGGAAVLLAARRRAS